MNRFERQVAGGFASMIGWMFAIALVSFWPWLLGTKIATSAGAAENSTAWNLAGWIPEAIWIAGLLVGALLFYRNKQLKIAAVAEADRQRIAAEAQRAQQHAAHRYQMSQTNVPWFDQQRGHFTHSTCSVRHRSQSTAARCKSTI